MKNIAIIVFIVIISSITNSTIAKNKDNEKTVTFSVDMECHSCANKIKDNISYEKGVKDLKVSLDNKECEVTYRTDKTTIENLIKAFNKIGYTAEVKKEKEDDIKSEHEIHGQVHNGHTHNMEH